MSSTSLIQPQQPTIGVVRAVNSGDSLVIHEVNKQGVESPDKVEYTLSHLTVPRLGYHGTPDKPATKDLPFAWESKEFLRKKSIGKKVNFYVDYQAPTGRKYITVYLVEDLENSLNKQMIESGWASLFRSASGKENKKPEYLNLIQLETAAQQQELGIHNKNPEAINNSVRPIHTLSPFDLYNKLQKKQLNAVVEQIRNANSYRVVILPSFHSFVVHLSGIQCPGYKRDASGTMQPEPYAQEAEAFITKNVLHRDVTITLDTYDKQGTLYGTVMCSDRDVAATLLKNGFGQIVAWTCAARTDQESLKQAEQTAKDQSLRVWSTPSTPVIPTSTTTTTATTSSTANPTSTSNIRGVDNPREINGKVIKIGNAGQIVIVTDQKVEYEVSLASLKVPMLTKVEDENALKIMSKDDQSKSRFERYYAYEAKEWLRKRLIGQRVQARLEYIRPAIAQSSLPEKPFYSVYLGKGNVSLGLVEAGLAKLLEHKGADNRAVDYEALIAAENKAKKKNAGLFSNKDNAPILNINDCSAFEDKNLKAKATKLLPHLRNADLPAVINLVISAQRFKIFIERDSCMINLSLSGVRVPKKEDDAVIADLALNYSKDQLMQHDVTIHIDDIDKAGNFIGSLYHQNKNYALSLVELGYASVHDPMRKLPGVFFETEEKAKNARLGIWKNYDPEEEKRQEEARFREQEEKNKASQAEFAEAIVRSVQTPTDIYVEFVNSKTEEIIHQLNLLETDNSTESLGASSLKVGDLARVRSDKDQKIYRAKVLEINNTQYKVALYDIGDVEQLSANRVHPLPAKYHQIPTLITPVSLAYLKSTPNEDVNNDAIDFLDREFAGITLKCTVQSRDENNKMSVVLKDDHGCINTELLRNGLVKIDPRARGSQLDQFKSDEKTAIDSRIGFWRFGNIGSDDEDESNPKPGFNKKRFQKKSGGAPKK
ncbi:hypothetical protein DLAC_01596 [Tieghemostelium lacteum]|uniref:Nuclease domain-containing protein n=1 Tax=Tieghemostelium lacteum TaxID=361077 RepID=A0A152A5T3_TIELA|nr:hypothetical protein DLAC_01596 [Tieghemostelium lacteum]|eukprot:KYR01596.1 hypothetical protein DLAC_01596 [Tieghemostelium lacteum]